MSGTMSINRLTPGSFFTVDHDWFDAAMERLKPYELRQLLFLLRRYNGRNNGKLYARYRNLETKLGQSQATTAKATKVLRAAGFIRPGAARCYVRLTFLPVIDEDTHDVVIPATNEWKEAPASKYEAPVGNKARFKKRSTHASKNEALMLQKMKTNINGQETRCSVEKMPPEGGPPPADAGGVREKVLDFAKAIESEPETPRRNPKPRSNQRSAARPPDAAAPDGVADDGDGASSWDEEIAELDRRNAIWRASRQQRANPDIAVNAINNSAAPSPRLVPNGLCTKCGHKHGEVFDYGGMLLHSTCVAAYEADQRERNGGGEEPLDF